MIESGDRNRNSEPATKLPQQYFDLKLEVEHLQRVVDRLQGLALLLAGGLAFGLLVSLAISGWFAYSLQVQRRATTQAERRLAQEREVFLERVEDVQVRLDSIEQSWERLRDADRLQAQRDRQLILQLRERLNALTGDIEPVVPESEAPTEDPEVVEPSR